VTAICSDLSILPWKCPTGRFNEAKRSFDIDLLRVDFGVPKVTYWLSLDYFSGKLQACVLSSKPAYKEINYRSLLSWDVRLLRRRKKTSILDGIFTIISAVI
jgi:hypothetical protein